jgi:MoaA/NifB/PqqE/SkfB family radical SAM enzyme
MNFSNLLQLIKEKFLPQYIYLIVTKKCNLKCIFCSSYGEDSKYKLSNKKFLNLVEESCKFRPKRIFITGGGEPLLKKNLVVKIVSLIKQFNIICDIDTNGTLFDEKFVKKIVKLKLDRIRISINSTDEKTEDFLKGENGSFKKMIKGLKLINKWKRKFNSSSPTLKFNILLTKYNWENIPNMIKLADKYKVDEIEILPLQRNKKTGKILFIHSRRKEKKIYTTLGKSQKISRDIQYQVLFPIF